MNDSDMCCVTEKQSIANVVLTDLNVLAERANTLEHKVNSKLSTVMRAPNLTVPGKECEIEQEYPPLFAELRSIHERLTVSLKEIENYIERTEL